MSRNVSNEKSSRDRRTPYQPERKKVACVDCNECLLCEIGIAVLRIVSSFIPALSASPANLPARIQTHRC